MAMGVAAPFFWRFGHARSMALSFGAAFMIVLAILGLTNPDPRQELATIEANRKQYHFLLACEIPMLALAIASFGKSRKVFWVGWRIHTALTALVIFVVVWLKFFWHW